jgi:hypothetical protein
MTDYSAGPAPEGLWIDVDFVLTPPKLTALKAYVHPQHGPVLGIFGYSELPSETVDGTVWTAQSLADATGEGFACGWIQHPLYPNWVPSENLGAIHEEHASAYAASVGFPGSMHGGLDVEGAGAPSYGYAVTWATNRVQRGGGCLGYHGYKLGMSLEQFAAMANVTSYWRALNSPPLPGLRGDAVIQLYPSVTIPGVGEVDLDLVAKDARGELPLVCSKLAA